MSGFEVQTASLAPEPVRRAALHAAYHLVEAVQLPDVVAAGEPSPVSPTDDDAFRLLEATIGGVFPDAVPAPYVLMAATDSRFFTAICDRVYRFAPFRMTKTQRESIHSYDERLGIDDFLDGVRWYQRLVEAIPR